VIFASSLRRGSRLALALIPLTAGVLLSSCAAVGSPAAAVNGHRITVDALEIEVTFFSRAGQQPVASPEALPAAQRQRLFRAVLTRLVQHEIAREYALTRGLVVSPREVDGQVQQFVDNAGGQRAFDRQLKQRHLTASEFRREVAFGLLDLKVQQDVLRRLGVDTSSTDQAAAQQAQAAFNRWMIRKLANVEVEVNPRYGRFDPRTGSVVAITSTAG
jgi:SurA-like protein